ncbi:MAG: hypothetical protein ACJAYU_002390 [Bradymonadia bacterium]
MVANSDDGLVVFASDGMVRVNTGVGIFVEGGDELTAASVRAVAADGDVLFILARLGDQDLLLRGADGPPTIVAQLQGSWQSLDVHDGSPVLGDIRDGRLVVAEVMPQGTGVSERIYPLAMPEGASASMRVRGDRVFAVVSAEEDYRLLELIGPEAIELFASASLIHGPLPIGETLLAVSDGALWELDDTNRILDGRVRYTCAAWAPDASFVCSQTALFEAFEGGVAIIPTFQHADLRPPLEATGTCQGEWLDYAGHAGIGLEDEPDIEPEPEDETAEPSPKSGCATATQSSHWLMASALAFLQVVRRRRTTASSR